MRSHHAHLPSRECRYTVLNDNLACRQAGSAVAYEPALAEPAAHVLSERFRPICREQPPPLSTPDAFITRLRGVGAADSLGKRLNLGRQVGAGGMGRVYQATDEASGRVLAIKLIQEVRGEQAISRFIAEADILESLDHPAIVAYVGHGTTADGAQYLAMDWLEGEDLGQRLARSTLSVPETVALGLRVADGLAAAHRAGIIHRDLKPSNIMLVGGDVDRATLVDFGIARRVGSDNLTRTGELVGTPGYMAPEQVRGRRDVDGRADLFALGCVLYQCLVGHPPFPGDDIMTVLAKLLLEEAPRLCTLRIDIPQQLDDLIERLLHKDGARRPAAADEVVAELAAIAAGLERGDLAIGTPPVVHAPITLAADTATVAPSVQRRRGLRRALALTIAAVAVAALIAVTRRNQPPTAGTPASAITPAPEVTPPTTAPPVAAPTPVATVPAPAPPPAPPAAAPKKRRPRPRAATAAPASTTVPASTPTPIPPSDPNSGVNPFE